MSNATSFRCAAWWVALAVALFAACDSSDSSGGEGGRDTSVDDVADGSVGPGDTSGGGDVAEDGSGNAGEDAGEDGSPDAGDAGDADPRFAESFRIVRIDASFSVAEQLAVHACAGLFNRRLGGSMFVQTDGDVPQASIDGTLVRDEEWLEPLGLRAEETIGADAFLRECRETFGGCVRYDYATQREILPSILTVAAARGVPPLADGSAVSCDTPVVDATEVFAGRTTQLLATEWVYENHLRDTTGLAMLNPGYDRFADDLSAPTLIDEMPMAMIDLVFSRRLFVVFLINGCIDRNPEKALLSRIVNESGWETPIGVFGYNDSWLAGGYVYEAQTRCLPSANMGAIPTRTTNLSFFDTRGEPITRTEALPKNPPQAVTWDPTKVYVAFVIGDGDNIRYMMSTRRDWLAQRLARCRDAEPACPPLTWTISPHLPDLAPDVLRWYYEAAATTGSDYFALPPSGWQYAYPGMMPADVQERFAAETERVGELLGTRSVIHWEWFQGWRTSVRDFLPRYARQGGQIRGIFPMNVPYLLEAFPTWPASRQYQVLEGPDGGRAVLFRSRSWRGVDDRDDYHPSPATMAARLAAFPPGTVTWIYMTSDGGLTLENSYAALTEQLPPHVQLVSTDEAARLAIEAR